MSLQAQKTDGGEAPNHSHLGDRVKLVFVFILFLENPGERKILK
jgi:hypothetical protein